MATNYPTNLLSSAFAKSGDKTIPPKTASEAGNGRFSQVEGWKEVNSQPITEGGVPPYREDFNGVLYLLSSLLLWYQQGGIMKYSTTLDYEVGNEVMQDGKKYRCIKANGPSSTKATPGTSKTYWKDIDISGVPAGMICPFYNVTLGGTDSRRPIFWGQTEADESWILCDGGSNGSGGTVPDLRNKFIYGGNVSENGTTGGASSLTTGYTTATGTVGATTLTLDMIPSHSHGSGTTDSAGGHTHTRGTMNITGTFNGPENTGSAGAAGYALDGAFYFISMGGIGTRKSDWDNAIFGFDASRAWTGATSENGAHTHTFNLASQGGGKSHTHTLTLNTHNHSISNSLPPYLKYAFFVKVPD